MSGSAVAAFLLASLVLAVTPGPGVAYIVARTLAQGRMAGLASVAGVAAGNLGNALGASLGLAAVRALDTVLGIAAPADDALAPELTSMLEARAAARATRQWAESDRLRDELAMAGISVEDTRDGQRWRKVAASG